MDLQVCCNSFGVLWVLPAPSISSEETVRCFCFLLDIKSLLFFVQVQGKNRAVFSFEKVCHLLFFCAHVAVLSHMHILLYIYAVTLDVYTNMPNVAH